VRRAAQGSADATTEARLAARRCGLTAGGAQEGARGWRRAGSCAGLAARRGENRRSGAGGAPWGEAGRRRSVGRSGAGCAQSRCACAPWGEAVRREIRDIRYPTGVQQVS
jgi:hypothetical protein